MNELRNDVVINRALLTNPALDSGAVAVRGTLFHVFREAGDHDVTILRGDRVTARLTVVVQPEGATPQVNLDLAWAASSHCLARRRLSENSSLRPDTEYAFNPPAALQSRLHALRAGNQTPC